jgi:ZIP family zinc transporter
MMVILIACATFASTLAGGLVAMKLKDKLHLILGFSAGAVIGVAFFDLLPASIELAGGRFHQSTVTGTAALGFLVYLVLDRLLFLHAHAAAHANGDNEHGSDVEGGPSGAESKHIRRGMLGAGSLAIHSFLDGVAIGLGFQVSATIGAAVAAAVLVHDFSDGINTVSVIFKHRGDAKHAFRWLVADAVAPVLGVVSTQAFRLPEEDLGLVLALFSGFFLYIGASDLIPESHHGHPKFLTTVMTLLGAAVLYAAIQIAGT